MEEKERFKETYEQLLSYIKDRFELLRLQLTERATRGLSALLSKVVVGLLFFTFVFFASIGVSLYLGKLWGSYELGFLMVGGAYLFLFLLIALFRRPLLQRPMMSAMIRDIFNKEEDE